MPESKLFMSSLSRRQLARRRPGHSLRWSVLLVGLVVVLICAAAFVAGRGGI
jgi:hypothetical protein